MTDSIARDAAIAECRKFTADMRHFAPTVAYGPAGEAWINQWADTVDRLFGDLVVLDRQTGWQPIASAPKDGTEILVWGFAYGGWRSVLAHYMGNAPEDHPPIDPGWYHWRPGKRWSNGEQRFYQEGSFHQLVKPPTHWQPLPSPPVAEDRSTEEKEP